MIVPKITSKTPIEIAFNDFSDVSSIDKEHFFNKIPHASPKRLCLLELRNEIALNFKDLKSYNLKFKI